MFPKTAKRAEAVKTLVLEKGNFFFFGHYICLGFGMHENVIYEHKKGK